MHIAHVILHHCFCFAGGSRLARVVIGSRGPFLTLYGSLKKGPY